MLETRDKSLDIREKLGERVLVGDGARLIGCGTTPAHAKALAEFLDFKPNGDMRERSTKS